MFTIRRISIIFILALFVVMFVSSISFAAFKYVDSEGIPHLTDSIDSVPAQYRDQVKDVSGHTDGYIPTYEETVLSGDKENLWFKYEEMSWLDKKRIVAQAGLNDLQGIFNDMLFQFVIITLIFLGCAVMVFVKIKKNSLRFMTLFMITTCFGMVLMSFYIRTTMQRGNSVLDMVKGNNKSISAAKAQGGAASGNIAADGAASAAPGAPVGELATSLGEEEGGVMGQLKNLQKMSDERQKMFEMILNNQGQ